MVAAAGPASVRRAVSFSTGSDERNLDPHAVTSSLLSTALAEGHRIRAAIGAAAEALIRYRGG